MGCAACGEEYVHVQMDRFIEHVVDDHDLRIMMWLRLSMVADLDGAMDT